MGGGPRRVAVGAVGVDGGHRSGAGDLGAACPAFGTERIKSVFTEPQDIVMIEIDHFHARVRRRIIA